MFFALAPTGAAGAQDAPDPGVIDVLQVSGLVDPIVATAIASAVADAGENDSLAFVIQINSPGSVITDDEMSQLVEALRAADVPVGIWIGPSGAKARGGAEDLLAGADLSGIAARGHVSDERVSPTAATAAGLVDVVAPTLGDFLLALEDEGVTGGISRCG